MPKLNRRDFLCYLSAAALIPLVGQEEVSAHGKNIKMTAPIEGYTYVWVGGPVQCRSILNPRKKTFFPRVLNVSRVDYRANGSVVGSGIADNNFLLN